MHYFFLWQCSGLRLAKEVPAGRNSLCVVLFTLLAAAVGLSFLDRVGASRTIRFQILFDVDGLRDDALLFFELVITS